MYRLGDAPGTRAKHRASAAAFGSHHIGVLLVVANTINIAADLAAMGEALRLVVGGPVLIYALAFGFVCLTAEIFIPYHRYASYLKFLTFILLLFIMLRWRSVSFRFPGVK